ncbi:hypothetical protein PHYPSEUDO_001499 [Phytophthora pseudosyringae]|uniref:Uncharacterized protein n=1 Tax=Phytophthora pseudosyringae TaxID=221518 RepID=A0A8T1VZX0_9STRA|nr:hypothetical protein PHYPSEUDO_001499 [Phytophthora pseudosyringae]
MSVQSLASTADAKITPASASFEAAAAPSEDNSRRLSLFACLFDALTVTPAQVDEQTDQGVLEDAKPQPDNAADEQSDVPSTAATECSVVKQNPKSAVAASDATKTTPKEAEYARNNWLELRARVESVDPRVFAFQNDPKYLQQCEEAKQRRVLAAATSVSPGWY